MTDTTLTEARALAQDAATKIKEAQKAVADSIKGALKDQFDVFFETYPFLGGIIWTQYTPYFNDGDPCTFRTALDDAGIFSVNDLENQDWSAYENGPEFDLKAREQHYRRADGYVPNPNSDPEWVACEKAVRDFITVLTSGFPSAGYDEESVFDSALKQAFGDHAEVRLTREGFTVDEYEHE